MKFLITAALSAQAYKLKQLLPAEADFVLADQGDVPAFTTRENKFLKIPDGDSATFAHQLLTLCLDHQIDYVVPLKKKEILALAETTLLFEEYQIRVVVPPNPAATGSRSSVPANGRLVAGFKGEVLLTDQSAASNSYPETGVYVSVPEEYEVKYYIYTAD